MINLLPPQLKQDYGYARQNTSLLRIVMSFGLGIAGLAIIVAAGFIYLQQTANTYASQADGIEASLKQQKQEEVEKQVQEVSDSLKLAVQVLSKEVLFSQLLTQLGTVVPANTSLSNVSISEVGGALDISAAAIDYNAATQLQVNLADPTNKIFSKADIVSIACDAEPPKDSKYPCKVTIRALFAGNNSFLFINGKAAGN